MKNNLLIKCAIALIGLIFGFIFFCNIIDTVTQGACVSSKIEAKYNDLRLTNTTTYENFFSDTTAIYYESFPDYQYILNQYNESAFIYNGIKLPEIPTFSIAPTIDDNQQYALAISFASLKMPILGFEVLIRSEFSMSGAYLISTDGSSVALNYSITQTTANGYTVWNIYPNTATGMQLYIVFSTGFTTTTISRPIDSVVYQVQNASGAYDSGYNAGYDVGYNTGYSTGYDIGYDDGVSLGIENPENFFYTAWSLLTTLGNLFLVFFNTRIFGGITCGMVFIVLPFTMSILSKIISIIIKLISLGGE